MTEDYSDFFDDFSIECLYKDTSISVLVNVLLDQNIEKRDEFGAVVERVTAITFPKSVVDKPKRNATATISDEVYTLGDVISDDGFACVCVARR